MLFYLPNLCETQILTTKHTKKHKFMLISNRPCMCYTNRVCAVFSTTALVCAMTTPLFSHFCTIWAFLNAVAREPWWYVILSIAVVQPRLYLQYFLSRLHLSLFRNHTCKPYITAIKCLFSTSARKIVL